MVEQEEAKFIKDEELFEEILEKLNKVKSTLYIEDDDLALYIYQQYQWSEDKWYNFFNDDWEEFRTRAQAYDPNTVGLACQ